MAIEDHWPLFGLSITTDRLKLWYPSDSDLVAVMELIRSGVHDPAMMPFTTEWTDAESPELERGALQFWWRCRAEFSVQQWNLPFVVAFDGQIVGVQDLTARDFPTLRTTQTGSWLGLRHQGQGIGKEMRAAIVQFAFECLDATSVTSSAYEDNIASRRVSEATGYEENGTTSAVRRGEPGTLIRYLLTRDRWNETRSGTPADIQGFEACRGLLGLSPSDPPV